MIDTICLKHISTELTEAKLLNLGATAKPGRRNPIWFLNPPDGFSSLPRITIAQTPDAIFHIFAECSIPNLLYGHNSKLPETEEDNQRGIEIICEYARRKLGIRFEATSALIGKIHLTRDYYIGDAANNAAFALFDKRLRFFPKRNIAANECSANTLYFNCQSSRRNSVICIYPKHAEVLVRNGSFEAVEAAEGVLRIEYRANTRSGVKSLLKRFSGTEDADLLTRNLNDSVFQSLETELHFPQCVAQHQSPLLRLLAKYPAAKAQRLLGFLEMRRLKGDSEFTKSDCERRNFNAARRDCERAGVWLNLRET